MSEFAHLNDTAEMPLGIAALDAESGNYEGVVPEILIITGMSGAGRTKAGTTLEDLGWYVIDNLPPRLLMSMAKLITSAGSVQKLACIVDVRSREFFQELIFELDELRAANIGYRIIFLDADDETLVRRFESVRRPHPLQGDGLLLFGIRNERELLKDLRSRADLLIDTSSLSVHDLARKIRNNIATEGHSQVSFTVMSFGFKYGIPLDADHVADVRFIPNPYWVEELRHLTGKDEPVRDFVLRVDGAENFATGYAQLLNGVVSGYEHELKSYVTVAIGCTGGKHRSVAIAEEISRLLREQGLSVRTVHRDLGRE
ncbi:MAG: RNase adapter RapZ [Arcanobacterium sp.]|nr:RNase adapter RapZ [Arcanobacterium sp.]